MGFLSVMMVMMVMMMMMRMMMMMMVVMMVIDRNSPYIVNCPLEHVHLSVLLFLNRGY